MIDNFIERIMVKLNTIMTTYYEEAPTNAAFPYAVVTTISAIPLNYGFSCLFDVELYVNELTNTDLEAKCDELRVALDDYSERNSICGFHVGFDNQIMSRQTEQDITMRRITFTARIF